MTDEPYKIDRSGWPPGPWDVEPEDRIEWWYHAYPCLMLRNNFGSWCGYVGLRDNHPDYGKSLSELDECYCAHGGVTYAAEDEERIRCNLPGNKYKRWWVGFDCSHAWDLTPGLNMPVTHDERFDDAWTYKDKKWVRQQVEHLAEQARDRGMLTYFGRTIDA